MARRCDTGLDPKTRTVLQPGVKKGQTTGPFNPSEDEAMRIGYTPEQDGVAPRELRSYFTKLMTPGARQRRLASNDGEMGAGATLYRETVAPDGQGPAG